jgi:anti-anti-sigma regulatory factor
MNTLSCSAQYRHGDMKVVKAPTAIDISNANELLYDLMSAARKASIVVLDMTATTFCDSSGFWRLVMAGDYKRAIGGDLQVVCSARLRMLMAINEDDEHFTVFTTMSETFRPLPHSAQELISAA